MAKTSWLHSQLLASNDHVFNSNAFSSLHHCSEFLSLHKCLDEEEVKQSYTMWKWDQLHHDLPCTLPRPWLLSLNLKPRKLTISNFPWKLTPLKITHHTVFVYIIHWIWIWHYIRQELKQLYCVWQTRRFAGIQVTLHNQWFSWSI